jgi:tRNA-guanine family transglycosylase
LPRTCARSTRTSDCPALAKYSRAYLHHLVKSGEILGMMIVSWANVAYYQSLMSGIREAIAQGRFEDFPGRDPRGLAARRARATLDRA